MKEAASEVSTVVTIEFFKDDFEPKNLLEFEPKLKTSNGFCKFKLGVNANDSTQVKLGDETELQNRLGGLDYSLKLKEKEVTLQTDRGFIQTGDHWLNTYYLFKFPRTFSGLNGVTTSFGSVLHLNFPKVVARIHSELAVKHNNTKNEFTIYENAYAKWNKFIFASQRQLNLTNKFNVEDTGVINYTQDKVSAYIEAKTTRTDVLNNHPHTVSIGGSFAATDKVKLFGFGTRKLDETKQLTVSAGAEYKHCDGYSAKFAYFHNDKITGFFNFKLSNTWNAGLTLQQNIGEKKDLLWGAKFKFNV